MTGAGKVRYHLSEGVAAITLDAPDRRNALSPAMMAALVSALQRAAGEARAILLSGEGRSFCAGVDLSAQEAIPHADLDGGAILEAHVNPMVLAVQSSTIPIVVAVQGGTVGIGMALALSGDVIVAARNAFFVAPFVRLALSPDGGVAALLTRVIGRVRAMRLLMLAEKLPADDAMAWGLVTRVVDDALLAETSRAIAVDLARGPTLALGAIKALGWQAEGGDLTEALALERELQRHMPATLDCREGNAAFAEKRPPQFVGR